MTGKADEILENARELIHRHEERVIRELFPETNGKPITEGPFSIGRSLGNPSSIHYIVVDSVDNKEYSFNARYYSLTPGAYKGGISPPRKDYDSYSFLIEQAKIDFVPKAAFFDDAPDWLFTETIKGKTLRALLNAEKDEKARIKVLDEILPLIAAYQNKATYASDSLPEKDRRNLFWSRSIEEQAKDYLESYIGDEKEAENLAEGVYIPLLGSALRGRHICHGDLSPDNIIYNEDKKVFYFIDPELKERNQFSDLGCLISYLGDYESLWKRFAEKFKLVMTGLAMEEEGIKPAKIPLVSVPIKTYLEEKGKKDAYFELYSNILHNSLRMISKRVKRGNRNYGEQVSNIGFILNSWLSKPDEFGIAKDSVKKVKALEKHLLAEKAGVRSNDAGMESVMQIPTQKDVYVTDRDEKIQEGKSVSAGSV